MCQTKQVRVLENFCPESKVMMMNKDAIWGILVMILVAGLAAAIIDTGGVEVDLEPSVEQEEQIVVNETALLHDDGHLHAAPVLSLIAAEDDGASISLSGFTIHAHPDQVTVDVVFENESIMQFTPDASGLWNVSFNTNASGLVSLNLTATHALENTTSEPMVVDVDRDEDEVQDGTGSGGSDNNTDNSTGNSTDNGSGNQSGNTTDGGSDNSTGNSTDNGTGTPTGPTYNASDLGQFWLDMFMCQSDDEVTPSDDLTTSAVEEHECMVSITMNATHLTITSNGLPNHDFESTLACSQGGDCTAAQTYEWSIPRSPVNDTTGGHDAANCPSANGAYTCAPDRSDIAIAVNGVPFFGPEDGPGGDAVASHHGVFEEDRQPIELGVCHGHSAQGGTYHYHADANCLHWHAEEGEAILEDYDNSNPEAVAANTNTGNHSGVIGVALDGYPIYGFWGYDDNMNITEMTSSYRLKAGETGYNGIDDYEYIEGLGNLDVCNGHFGPTPDFPDGIYHYHSTMLNGEGDMGFPYFLICYHGEVDLADGGADCSGFGETWGPGIGPPPEGCEGGPSGQLEDVQLVSPVTVYSTTWLWLWLGMLAMLAVRWRLAGKA